MAIDKRIIDRARAGNGPALSSIAQTYYPMSVRLARGLTGREDLARRTMRFILHRSLRASGKWHDDGAPERWYMHHTVLAARAASRKAKEYGTDLLFGAGDETPYVAFIRAIRGLPRQQMEAFLLRAAEKFDERQTAVSMDLSTQATKVHFSTAEAYLKKLAGEHYDRYVAMLEQAWKVEPPPGNLIAIAVNSAVAKYIWPKRLWAMIRILFVLAVLGGIAYLVYMFWGRVEI